MWTKKTIGQVILLISDGGTPSRNQKENFGGDHCWIVIDDIKDEIYDTKEKLTDIGLLRCPSYYWELGTVILSTGATIGEVGITKVKAATKQGISGIVTDPKLITPEYLKYFFQLNKEKLKSLAQGSTIKEVRPPIVKSIPINLPVDIQEQNHIAQILSKADETISQTETLIAKYQRIKTGLMQDLLTKGIDEQGNIRSKNTHKFIVKNGIEVPEEWETVELEDSRFFNLATGGTPSTEVKEYWENGTIPWMSSGEVHKKEIWFTDTFISESGFQNSNARYYPADSIIIALAGQGKTRGTVAINKVELTSNQSIAAIIPNKAFVEPYFLFYYLESQYDRLRSISAGAGRAGLSLTIISKVRIPLPKKEEQERICGIIKGVDNQTNNNIIISKKLSLIKTGLMQDLLSGKVRVKSDN